MSPARLDLVLNLAVTLVVVASLKAVGSVLVIAMLLTPAAISRVLARRVPTSMIVSVTAAVIEVVQVPAPLQPPPLQPEEVEPAIGVAVSVTEVPWP